MATLKLCLAEVGAGLVAPLLIMCTPQQLGHVEDASSKRDTICRFVEVWAVDKPELSEIRDLCQKGADLKEIAAAYAGCRGQ